MKPSLQLNISQQLTMTPQLQQAIKLLQLSSLALQTEIQEALESNSLLELAEETPVEEDWKVGELPSLPSQNSTYQSANSDDHDAFESQRSADLTLLDHLLWQLNLTPFTDLDRLIATIMIESINDDGFLECTFEDIFETICTLLKENDQEDVADSLTLKEIEVVCKRVQQFDPPGVGARDLSECLLLQIQSLPDHPLKSKAIEFVTQYLGLWLKNDENALRRRLKVNQEELKGLLQYIQQLNPHPGSDIGSRECEYIVPDATVIKQNGAWKVSLNQNCNPRLQINSMYASLIKRADTSADNLFLKNQLQEARWFIKSLENRNETLMKVVTCIVKYQKDFLEHGEEAMKPMVLHDVAQEINMHESTISRVTTQKYLHTPRGTFELKYFFSSHVHTASGGECSSTAIRALIKKLISAENRSKPLSDSKLSKILAEEGIHIARRTVAKYREALRIPASSERKRLL